MPETDLAAEAALVAEALGAEVFVGERMVEFHFMADHCTALIVPDQRGIWPAQVALARRLRETEQERDEWKAAAEYHYADVKALLGHGHQPPRGSGTPTQPPGGSGTGRKPSEQHATAVSEAGPSGFMGAMPARDHCTGGYRLASGLQPAAELPAGWTAAWPAGAGPHVADAEREWAEPEGAF